MSSKLNRKPFSYVEEEDLKQSKWLVKAASSAKLQV
jgi:hypothetical protein